ncbi:MAG: 2OG-Fe(II) oxygenase [Gammaproteobacteria bacterium]|nr:2OG-Fe(II) oxygenase [Gammaproteobacteria bacterium]
MDDFIGRFENNISAATCQGLIKLFEEAHQKKLTHAGKTGKVHDPKRKDSTDLSSTQITAPLQKKYGEVIQDFFASLVRARHEYQERYPLLKPPRTYPLGVFEFNIQRYYAGGQAYHAWHYENPYPQVVDRVLTWMTYLNDVEEGGETEFEHQQVKTRPKEGLTLIWPAGFTHSHRGLPAQKGTKYIITGWFRFAPEHMLKG